MELKDRLKRARKNAGLTQKDIESNIPNMKQSTYSELERGLSKSTSRIVDLASLFKVSAEWLATGEGEMTATNKLSDYVVVGSDNADASNDDYVMIDQYDVAGSCGDGALIGDVAVKGGLAFKRDWINAMGVNSDNLATIYAQGDSMSPTIEDGQVLLVDKAAIQPQSTKIYIICIDEQLYIKRLVNLYDRWVMRSDNPDKSSYPDIEISAETMASVDVQGRIVWQAGIL